MKETLSEPPTVYCDNCRKQVTYHFNKVDHWQSLLLVVLTLGIWLPMWLMGIFCPTKICDVCKEPMWENH